MYVPGMIEYCLLFPSPTLKTKGRFRKWGLGVQPEKKGPKQYGHILGVSQGRDLHYLRFTLNKRRGMISILSLSVLEDIYSHEAEFLQKYKLP